ncbi:MAG: Uma2 family endonuclease [Caldilineaceae bacterium]
MSVGKRGDSFPQIERATTVNGHSPDQANGHNSYTMYHPHDDRAMADTLLERAPNLPQSEWPIDLLEAYARPHGPYTVDNAEGLLDESSVELYHGWLVQQEMTTPRERRVVATLQSMLDVSARKVGFGQMLPDQLECLLNDGSVIKPDCSLISWTRLDSDVIPYGSRKHLILQGCPELVVESRSPSNWRAQERRKRELYFTHGTQLVWDVDEESQEIWAWYAHSPDQPRYFGPNDELHCEPLLPSWRRRVADIFAEHASAEAVVGEVAVIWRAEGRTEGIEVGRAEGIEAGMSQMLLSLLPTLVRATYGEEPPADLVTRLRACNLAQLQQLQTALASTPTLTAWLALVRT